MTDTWSRTWTDTRDGARWEVVYNPGVELDTKPVRDFRERLVFTGEGGVFNAPAVYGSALDKLTDEDLGGLLDQARNRTEGEEKARAPG